MAREVVFSRRWNTLRRSRGTVQNKWRARVCCWENPMGWRASGCPSHAACRQAGGDSR